MTRPWIDHLRPGSCGNCAYWHPWDSLRAVGYCERPDAPDPPFRCTDYGSLETRLDHGCFEFLSTRDHQKPATTAGTGVPASPGAGPLSLPAPAPAALSDASSGCSRPTDTQEVTHP